MLLLFALFANAVEIHHQLHKGSHPAGLITATPKGVAFVQYNFWSNNGTDMLMSYYTQERADGTSCKYGTKSGVLDHASNNGVQEQWKSGYGWNHHVLLSNLTLNTKYYFRCGFADSIGWSDELFFTTRAATVGNFTIGVVGDMGIWYSSETMARLQQRTSNNEWAFIWHIGDISYADDHVFWFQETWNTWYTMMTPTLARVPYMTLPGNHEHASLDPFLYEATKNFKVYNQRFRMPQDSVQEKANSSMWYSFNYGPVHYVAISTETSYPNAPWDITMWGDQIDWLKKDLAAANTPSARRLRPWLIVGGHRPIYSSSIGYSSNGVPEDQPFVPINCATLQKVFENLFIANQVDLVLAGHVHSYERLYPTAVNKPTQTNYVKPNAPTYVVIGNAGNIEGLTDSDYNPLGFGGWQSPAPSWSAYRYGDGYGYATMTIDHGSSLTWRFHHASDDRVLDEFVITK